ncbi:hypothetical protein [Streptomyces sp. NPDC097619]|uniref:hypothetical protein n=1 Tax=Streptomyces sp. NPDC097619 TaxID=3157228 RepID=UPI003326CABD
MFVKKAWFFSPLAAAALVAGVCGSAVAVPAESVEDAPSYAQGPTSVEQLSDEPLAALPEVNEDPETPVVPRCDNPYKEWTDITSKTPYFVKSMMPGTSFKDGPGGTMTVSVTKAGIVRGSITVGGEAEFSGLVVKAKAKVDVAIGAEFAYTVGHTYTHGVSRGKYGHLQYGASGYKMGWAKYKTSADRCSKVKIKGGTVTLPTRELGWTWWETNS